MSTGMVQLTDRRAVLKGVVGGLASLALPQFALAASGTGISFLSDNITLVTIAGINVLTRSTADGLVLVDSSAPEHSGTLMEQLKQLSDSGVHILFNTHWHTEQTGSNESLGKTGARIIAHEKTRLRLSTDYYLPQEERYHRALPKEAQPVESFYTTGAITAGSERIEYGYLQQAHTDGDIYVYFRDSNVLAVGDVASPERDPVLDWYGGGWIGGRVDAMDLLLEISDDGTQIVPAFGSVMNRAQLRAERDMMAFLYERMVDLLRDGYSARDMLEEGVMAGLVRNWSDPYKFLYDAHKGLWAHHNKLAPNIV